MVSEGKVSPYQRREKNEFFFAIFFFPPRLFALLFFFFLTNRPNCKEKRKHITMGKVHGSLARAGKVKSQTPKVDKEEKKKQPKGRAKKRLLYTSK